MAGRGLVWALLRRPRLWGEALRAGVALSPRAWWTRRPFVPRPDPQYVAWRTATAYGSAAAQLDSRDVVQYLDWRRTFRRANRRGGLTSG